MDARRARDAAPINSRDSDMPTTNSLAAKRPTNDSRRALRARLDTLHMRLEVERNARDRFLRNGDDTLHAGAVTRIDDIEHEIATIGRELDALASMFGDTEDADRPTFTAIDLGIDNLLVAGAALAQTVQDLADDTLDSANDDPETVTAATALHTIVNEWEAAYASTQRARLRAEMRRLGEWRRAALESANHYRSTGQLAAAANAFCDVHQYDQELAALAAELDAVSTDTPTDGASPDV
jgi:hypothetical protein